VYSTVEDRGRLVQYCGGWRSVGTVLWRIEVRGYSTVEDGDRRVQYCGGWRSKGTALLRMLVGCSTVEDRGR
jgi:hypothetical protein